MISAYLSPRARRMYLSWFLSWLFGQRKNRAVFSNSVLYYMYYRIRCSRLLFRQHWMGGTLPLFGLAVELVEASGAKGDRGDDVSSSCFCSCWIFAVHGRCGVSLSSRGGLPQCCRQIHAKGHAFTRAARHIYTHTLIKFVSRVQIRCTIRLLMLLTVHGKTTWVR